MTENRRVPEDRREPASPSIRNLVGRVALLLVLGCCGDERPGADPAQAPRPLNLLLVLSDTHRRDHVTPFGDGGRQLTPNLELLARDGMRFTNISTPIPISAPAYASLLTGLSPGQHGLFNNGQHLAEAFPMLPSAFGAAGFQTAAVVSNVSCSAGHGFARGFEWFWDEVEGHGKAGSVVTEQAAEWLESRDRSRPFFLFVAYMDAHTPYVTEATPPSLLVRHRGEPVALRVAEDSHQLNRVRLEAPPGRSRVELVRVEAGAPASPPDAAGPLHLTEIELSDEDLGLRWLSGQEPIDGTSYTRLANRAVLELDNPTGEERTPQLTFRIYRLHEPAEIPRLYEEGVRAFDRHFGRLLGYLREQGLYEDTAIVFVADHGEMLGERDRWGHVGALDEPAVGVPMIVKAPGLTGGSVSPVMADLTEVHDWIARLAEHATWPPIPAEPTGRSLIAATYPPEASRLLVSVRRGPLLLVSDGGEHRELFDLEGDEPGRDIYKERRGEPTVKAMWHELRTALAEALQAPSLNPESLSEKERRRLRALGYLD